MSPERLPTSFDEPPISETRYEGVVRPSDAVVDALAETEGVPPLDLDPLYDTIDPDAVDRIFGRPREVLPNNRSRLHRQRLARVRQRRPRPRL